MRQSDVVEEATDRGFGLEHGDRRSGPGDDSLELSALAIALTSSVFALVAYAALEGLKIRLYARLLGSLRDVEALFHKAGHKADPQPAQALSSASQMPKRAPTSA